MNETIRPDEGRGDGLDDLHNAKRVWTRLEKIAASGLITGTFAIVITICAGVYTMTAKVTKFETELDHKLQGMATAAQLEKSREAILYRLDKHDEVFKDISTVLESANRSVLPTSVKDFRIGEKLDGAREKTQGSVMWNRRNLLKPFEGAAFRQGQALVMLAAGESSPVAAGSAGVVHVRGADIEIEMKPGVHRAYASAASPVLMNAVGAPGPFVGESLVYRGLTKTLVKDGDEIARGQTIGILARAGQSPMVALKLTIEFRASDGSLAPPPQQLQPLDLGLEIFEFKCASCHARRDGADPSLSQLRSRNLTREQAIHGLHRGGPNMPDFSKILSTDEQEALVDLLTRKTGRSVTSRANLVAHR